MLYEARLCKKLLLLLFHFGGLLVVVASFAPSPTLLLTKTVVHRRGGSSCTTTSTPPPALRMVKARDVKYHAPDRYGQEHPIETPELIARKHVEFDREVAKLSTARSVLEAQRRCPELLTDNFKLMFLRAEVFNTPLAAARYANYWDKRIALFGQKAFQRLTLDLLDSDSDKVARASGLFNLFEANGRMMAFEQIHKYNLQRTTRESYIRTFWYLVHVALENEETQKRGMIVVNYPAKVNIRKQKDIKFLRLAGSLQGAIPARLSVYHVCYPPVWVRFLWPLLTILLGKRLQKRVLLHAGTQEQVIRHLERYGLNKQDLPVEIGGERTIDMSKFYREKQAAGL